MPNSLEALATMLYMCLSHLRLQLSSMPIDMDVNLHFQALHCK